MTRKAKLDTNTIKLRSMPNGDHQSIVVYRLTWDNPGPILYIQSSVHGAEVQGNAAILSLLDYLKKTPFNGEVIFVPYANPFSINQKAGTHTHGRFNPVTGENWNRSFINLAINQKVQDFIKAASNQKFIAKDLKNKFKALLVDEIEKAMNNPYGISDNRLMCYTLQKLASQADYVLDLHCGPVATDYIYSLYKNMDEVKAFNIPFVLVVPPIFGGAMDEAIFMPWHALEEEIGERLGVESYTVELRSEEVFDLEESILDRDRILNYMKSKAMLESSDLSPRDIYASEMKNFKTYYAPLSGQIVFKKKVGDLITKGDVIAEIVQLRNIATDEETHYQIRALNNAAIINTCPTHNVFQGMELVQVLENIEKLKS